MSVSGSDWNYKFKSPEKKNQMQHHTINSDE